MNFLMDPLRLNCLGRGPNWIFSIVYKKSNSLVYLFAILHLIPTWFYCEIFVQRLTKNWWWDHKCFPVINCTSGLPFSRDSVLVSNAQRSSTYLFQAWTTSLLWHSRLLGILSPQKLTILHSCNVKSGLFVQMVVWHQFPVWMLLLSLQHTISF